MTIATGRPKGRPRKLTQAQQKQLAERHGLYVRLRVEAARHSPYALAKDFGVSQSTVQDYLDRTA